MAERLWNLRIFADEAAHLNRSAAELDLPLLVVSQFTLYGDTTKGRRPSFDAAAPGPVAEPLIERLAATLESFGEQIAASAPLKRIGRPDDMAGTALFLTSRAGAYLTGAVIPVDGGIATVG